MAEILRAQKEELTRELHRLTDVPRDPVAAVSFGKRIGDGTTEAVERIAQTSAAKSLWAKLQDVERAIGKLAEGTYGTCDECGGPIPPERLEAIPSAVLCVSCARSRR